MPVVTFEKTGDVGHIVLCDPPDHRLGRAFVDDLIVAVHQASVSGARAILVRSQGPNFGTGADVTEWPGQSVDWFHTFIAELNFAYKALEALRVPKIAAVRGKLVGGHYELVLHCDLIVAARTATFVAVETRTGMVQLVGGLQRLAERVGRGRALDLALFSTPLTGEEGQAIGLVHRAVEDGEVDRVATELAERLAAGPTLAYGAALALLKAWSAGGVPGSDDLLLDLTMRLFESEDAQQSFRAIKRATETGGDKSEFELGLTLAFAGR